jgi:sugar transferase (PEP-CTERM/EpsH1 system associated)
VNRDADLRPLIAHVVYRLAVGGLENGLINLINHIPQERYQHAVICIDDYTDFSQRIRRPDVKLIAIRKRPGTDPLAFWRLYRACKYLKPTILHTRNLPALDALLPARLAGVPFRIHSEHGRDMTDLDGTNRKLKLVRRLHRPLVSHFVALSDDLGRYLVRDIGVNPAQLTQIYNGVDTITFRPALDSRDFEGTGAVLTIGTVGRLQQVKDHLNLVEAFILLLSRNPQLKGKVRLKIVGDGPVRKQIEKRLQDAQVNDCVSLPGSTDNVPAALGSFDVFVLPSLAEGISNTILEAMATGLPVVATDVGGNAELVVHGTSGLLVPAADPQAMCAALEIYVRRPNDRIAHGQAGRNRAIELFSMDAMIDRYLRVYELANL